MSDKYADLELVKNEDKKRFEMEVENHKAFVEYILTNDNVMFLTHTEVPKALEGKGVGGSIVEKSLKYIKANGGEVITSAEVTGYQISNGEVKAVETSHGNVQGDLVIMTGGSWLPQLSKLAGLSIPVMPGKGYSFMEPNSEHKIVHPALLIEARVAVTPMNGQVRFGGTMELAALNKDINMNRVEGIVDSIPKYYPELNVEIPAKDKIWYGFRPCSPDGLPYLGYSKKLKNLIIAGGHGMMGISLGPATGKMVAELANRTTLSADIKLYDPERYN